MVRWESGRRSSNVDDRRQMSPRGLAFGGGGGTILMLLLVFFLTGGDLGKVLQFFVQSSGIQQQQQPQTPVDPRDDELFEFASVILADTEDVWTKLFREEVGREYTPPQMVVYRGQVQTGCGFGSAAAGPFYCPADQKVYLDLSFYQELADRFGAPGDFARAYVIAHEVGHHVQNLLGVTDRDSPQRRRYSENEFSVRLELQADFLAGVWAHHADRERNLLEEGDIEEGLQAANAIGDDTLQKQAQGYAVPDSFTHGSSQQRMRWFMAGYKSGRLEDADTFTVPRL